MIDVRKLGNLNVNLNLNLKKNIFIFPRVSFFSLVRIQMTLLTAKNCARDDCRNFLDLLNLNILGKVTSCMYITIYVYKNILSTINDKKM